MISLLAIASFQLMVVRSVQSLDSVWYRAIDVRDLTGDGIPDTLILRATGHRVDSLQVTLDIRSQGRGLYHEAWLSNWYFQYDAPLYRIDEQTKRSRVFHHLRAFFRPESFALLDTAGAGRPWRPSEDDRDPRNSIAFDFKYGRALDSLMRTHVPRDSAQSIARRDALTASLDSSYILRVWQDLARRRPMTFTFFSGGEYTRTIVWSPVVRRFVIVFSCC